MQWKEWLRGAGVLLGGALRPVNGSAAATPLAFLPSGRVCTGPRARSLWDGLCGVRACVPVYHEQIPNAK